MVAEDDLFAPNLTSQARALAAAKDETTPKEILIRLAGHSSRRVRSALLTNPACPPLVLASLAKLAPSYLLKNPVFPLLLLENPNFVSQLSSDALCALLRLHQVPPELLLLAATHRSEEVRRSVAQHRATPPEVLARLLSDSDSTVRHHASLNPFLPKAEREFLRSVPLPLHLSDRWDKSLPSLSPAQFAALVSRGGYFEQIALLHPDCPPEYLVQAADSSQPERLQSLSMCAALSPALVERLLANPACFAGWVLGLPNWRPPLITPVHEERWRTLTPNAMRLVAREVAAFRTPAATSWGARLVAHPRASYEVFQILQQSRVESVRALLARAPALPGDLRKLLAQDVSPSVRALFSSHAGAEP